MRVKLKTKERGEGVRDGNNRKGKFFYLKGERKPPLNVR